MKLPVTDKMIAVEYKKNNGEIYVFPCKVPRESKQHGELTIVYDFKIKGYRMISCDRILSYGLSDDVVKA